MRSQTSSNIGNTSDCQHMSSQDLPIHNSSIMAGHTHVHKGPNVCSLRTFPSMTRRSWWVIKPPPTCSGGGPTVSPCWPFLRHHDVSIMTGQHSPPTCSGGGSTLLHWRCRPCSLKFHPKQNVMSACPTCSTPRWAHNHRWVFNMTYSYHNVNQTDWTTFKAYDSI